MLHKKVFLEILQNFQESTCVRVTFLIKVQALTTKQVVRKVLFPPCLIEPIPIFYVFFCIFFDSAKA